MCKRKVIPGDPDESDSESDSDEDAGPSENTPLLRGGTNATSRSENTFNNSGEYLLTASEVWGKVMLSVCPHLGGGVPRPGPYGGGIPQGT